MKAYWKYTILAVSVAALVLLVTGVALAGSSGAGATAGAGGSSASTAAVVPLSAHVEKHLVTLREEEKLARDVYAVLYDTWGVEAFDKIAAAEGRHMAAVKKLLDRYDIADPVGGNGPGVFTNAKIQAAYNEAVAKGAISLDDAYKVGIAIEKADIALLRDLLGDTTRRDIKLVVKNLLVGSQNHLTVFTKLLTQ